VGVQTVPRILFKVLALPLFLFVSSVLFPTPCFFPCAADRLSVATMFKRYAKDLPEEVLNWRLGYAVLGMLGLA
jgi:hypothetical protein